MIVREAVELHQSMIREAKGIPGVKPDRWQEAMTVKHCALSLVGEPIMYPRINELVRELHARHISSFLVTNAQVNNVVCSNGNDDVNIATPVPRVHQPTRACYTTLRQH